MAYHSLVRQMTLWPTLVRENAQLRQGDATVNADIALERAGQVLQELSRIDEKVDKLLWESEYGDCAANNMSKRSYLGNA